MGRASRSEVVAYVWVFALLVGACGANDAMTGTDAAAVARRGTDDAAERLGPSWQPPHGRLGVDTLIARDCGDPAPGLRTPSDGLIASTTSPVLARDVRSGASPPKGYGNVRTAVLVYQSRAQAERAFARLQTAPFEACLVTAVQSWLDAQGHAYDDVPDPTVDSFDTAGSVANAGEQATVTGARFDEEVIGGFDNEHDAARFVARSGSVVVVAIAASNTQTGDPENPGGLARRLGVAALDRVSAS